MYVCRSIERWIDGMKGSQGGSRPPAWISDMSTHSSVAPPLFSRQSSLSLSLSPPSSVWFAQQFFVAAHSHRTYRVCLCVYACVCVRVCEQCEACVHFFSTGYVSSLLPRSRARFCWKFTWVSAWGGRINSKKQGKKKRKARVQEGGKRDRKREGLTWRRRNRAFILRK